MRVFYLAWRTDAEILPQPVAELPWGHNTLLLEKLPDADAWKWYAA